MKKFFFILVAGSLLCGCAATSRSSLALTAHADKPPSFLGYHPAYDVNVTYKIDTMITSR